MLCPICNSNTTEFNFELINLPVTINYLYKTQQDAINCIKSEIFLKECSNCQHIFNTTFDSTLVNYDSNYHNSLFSSPIFKKEANLIAKEINDTFRIKNKSVLEIACGEGDFSRLISTFNPKKIIAFDNGIKPIIENSISFVNANTNTFDAEELFDIIICRHFLEHIDQPKSFFDFIEKHSEKNAYIYIEVPNADYMINESSLADIIYEHPHYFGEQSISHLFKIHNCEIIKIKKYFNNQFLGLFVKKGSNFKKSNSNRLTFENFISNCRKNIILWNKTLNSLTGKK